MTIAINGNYFEYKSGEILTMLINAPFQIDRTW